VIELIRQISRENPTWGAPRILGERLTQVEAGNASYEWSA